MTTSRDRELLRLLHGELDGDRAARLRERLAADPRLSARLEAMTDAWSALEPPPAPSAPPGLRGQILAAARTRTVVAPPRWLAAGVAVALAGGLALGFGFGRLDERPEPVFEIAPDRRPSSLAEAWLAAWRPEAADRELRR